MDNQQKITDVVIEPGCISCGACEFTAPEVFKVTDISHVQQGVDWNAYRQKIIEAAQFCPVAVIKYKQE